MQKLPNRYSKKVLGLHAIPIDRPSLTKQKHCAFRQHLTSVAQSSRNGLVSEMAEERKIESLP